MPIFEIVSHSDRMISGIWPAIIIEPWNRNIPSHRFWRIDSIVNPMKNDSMFGIPVIIYVCWCTKPHLIRGGNTAEIGFRRWSAAPTVHCSNICKHKGSPSITIEIILTYWLVDQDLNSSVSNTPIDTYRPPQTCEWNISFPLNIQLSPYIHS